MTRKLAAALEHDQKVKLSEGIKNDIHLHRPMIDLKLPRREVQEVIGVQHLVIIEYIAQLLLRRVQEVIIR